jgi:hypothetical protein
VTSEARNIADPALWYGDTIEILLETDRHSYYQIAVNPAGAIIDLDHSMDKNNRQRVRDGSTEHSGFAPTGAKGFHVPMKFGHF